MGNASALAGLLLLFGAVSASPAQAQTTTADGAYAKLSPGNAKIASALYEAQVQPTSGGTTSRTLTRDEIAAMKQNGQGWGQVFKQMKAQGLVADKNLGQVVSRYQHQQHSGGVVTTASNRAGGSTTRTAKADDADGSVSGGQNSGHGNGATSAGNSGGNGNGNGYGRSSGGGNGNSGKSK